MSTPVQSQPQQPQQQPKKQNRASRKNTAPKPDGALGDALKNALPYEVVGSYRVKRLKPKPTDQKIGMLIDPEDFKQLQLIGLRYGVTFCEVVKGFLNREIADVNGGSTLSHFIPVLNI
ncbi:hypothetical protein [Mucilaginibacter flavus]|uniref:hypothetical protein n=1 Tax=Mucilaginibacter flavus TaxID=931504 RepID=UPI0025B3AB02|nr:hypothetical protein [Mucilaginibacter flavus]MDN3584739.1 hypothetical protein [Mucilaginibacter flavus]